MSLRSNSHCWLERFASPRSRASLALDSSALFASMSEGRAPSRISLGVLRSHGFSRIRSPVSKPIEERASSFLAARFAFRAHPASVVGWRPLVGFDFATRYRSRSSAMRKGMPSSMPRTARLYVYRAEPHHSFRILRCLPGFEKRCRPGSEKRTRSLSVR